MPAACLPAGGAAAWPGTAGASAVATAAVATPASNERRESSAMAFLPRARPLARQLLLLLGQLGQLRLGGCSDVRSIRRGGVPGRQRKKAAIAGGLPVVASCSRQKLQRGIPHHRNFPIAGAGLLDIGHR